MSESWLVAINIQDADWVEKYIVSLYWSGITTLTVGYGDVVPVTPVERLFVIVVALIICGVFGYAVSSIGDIFRSL
jgi:voltage-gated potassium channel Kch